MIGWDGRGEGKRGMENVFQVLPRAIWPMAVTFVGSDEDRGGTDLWGKARINSALLICRALKMHSGYKSFLIYLSCEYFPQSMACFFIF